MVTVLVLVSDVEVVRGCGLSSPDDDFSQETPRRCGLVFYETERGYRSCHRWSALLLALLNGQCDDCDAPVGFFQ